MLWYVVFILIMLCCPLLSKADTCDQQLLDQFYLAVQGQNAGLAIEKLNRMNAHMQYQVDYEEPVLISFEPFHTLCKGQRSTYESDPSTNNNPVR